MDILIDEVIKTIEGLEKLKIFVDEGIISESIDDDSGKRISLEEVNIDDRVISVDTVEVSKEENGKNEENSGVSIGTDVRSIGEDGRVRIEVDVLKEGVKILMDSVSSELDIGSSMFLEELRIVGSGTNIIVVEGAINISEDNIEVGSKNMFEGVFVSTGK